MRLILDARARRWLGRFRGFNAYSLAELVLGGLLALQCARLVWAIVAPIGPLGDWRPAAPTLAESPGAILTGFDPFFRLSGGESGPAVITSLQLTLFGTRIDEAMGRSSAILAGGDGVQKSIVVGEEIVPGVKLKEVAFDHVTIDRGGADEDLFLDQSGAVAPVSPGVPSLAPAVVAAAANPGAIGIDQLRSEIGFIPRIDSGRLTGLVVRPQGSGAVFRQAGLKEGDVVTSIGGRPVTGRGDIERAAADFSGGGNLPITVERGDQTLPLAIAIAGK